VDLRRGPLDRGEVPDEPATLVEDQLRGDPKQPRQRVDRLRRKRSTLGERPRERLGCDLRRLVAADPPFGEAKLGREPRWPTPKRSSKISS
jgi:hypothetical protein